MFSRIFITRTIRSVALQNLPNYSPIVNLSQSINRNIRFYSTNLNDNDLLFDLGKEIKKTSPRPKKISPESVNLSEDKLAFREKKTNEKNAINFNSLEEQKITDDALGLTYVKLPHDHPSINQLLTMTRSKLYRDKKHLLMAEGHRLIIDMINAGLPLNYLYFSRIEKLEIIKDHLQKCIKQPEIFRVPQRDLTFWSVMTTCPGLIAIFEKPNDMEEIWRKAKISSYVPELNVTVVCDQIREPNNVGSIIRTCAAMPSSQIILMKGCADPWEPKALRGGCGSQFRVPIHGPIEWSSLHSFLPANNAYSVFVATNHQKIQSRRKEFHSKPYTDIQYENCNHTVVIVGGETEGISDSALEFMSSFQYKQNSENIVENSNLPLNTCIHIPLANGMESLNSNAAAAIMLFEIRKHLANQ